MIVKHSDTELREIVTIATIVIIQFHKILLRMTNNYVESAIHFQD